MIIRIPSAMYKAFAAAVKAYPCHSPKTAANSASLLVSVGVTTNGEAHLTFGYADVPLVSVVDSSALPQPDAALGSAMCFAATALPAASKSKLAADADAVYVFDLDGQRDNPRIRVTGPDGSSCRLFEQPVGPSPSSVPAPSSVFVVNATSLASAIRRVLPAVATGGDSRYALECVRLQDHKGSMVAVASDTHRLYKADMGNWRVAVGPDDLVPAILVCRDYAKWLSGVIEPCNVLSSATLSRPPVDTGAVLFVSWASTAVLAEARCRWTVRVDTLDSGFPRWENIIENPEEWRAGFSVDNPAKVVEVLKSVVSDAKAVAKAHKNPGAKAAALADEKADILAKRQIVHIRPAGEDNVTFAVEAANAVYTFPGDSRWLPDHGIRVNAAFLADWFSRSAVVRLKANAPEDNPLLDGTGSGWTMCLMPVTNTTPNAELAKAQDKAWKEKLAKAGEFDPFIPYNSKDKVVRAARTKQMEGNEVKEARNIAPGVAMVTIGRTDMPEPDREIIMDKPEECTPAVKPEGLTLGRVMAWAGNQPAFRAELLSALKEAYPDDPEWNVSSAPVDKQALKNVVDSLWEKIYNL